MPPAGAPTLRSAPATGVLREHVAAAGESPRPARSNALPAGPPLCGKLHHQLLAARMLSPRIWSRRLSIHHRTDALRGAEVGSIRGRVPLRERRQRPVNWPQADARRSRHRERIPAASVQPNVCLPPQTAGLRSRWCSGPPLRGRLLRSDHWVPILLQLRSVLTFLVRIECAHPALFRMRRAGPSGSSRNAAGLLLVTP
jgi:hypothetical protein